MQTLYVRCSGQGEAARKGSYAGWENDSAGALVGGVDSGGWSHAREPWQPPLDRLTNEGQTVMHEELEKLIDLALADGEISASERAVLEKKATALGVDLDELNMVLEARLHLQQKEGAKSTRDNIIKCPACNDIAPALSRVCPSCGYVLDSRSGAGAEKGLEDLIEDVENDLVAIKSLERPNVVKTMWKNSHISMPALTLVLMIIAWKTSGMLFFVSFLCMGVSAWVVYQWYQGKKAEKADDSGKPNYNNLKAHFEKHSRTARTLFGENKKVRLLLEEIQTELGSIESQMAEGKKVQNIVFASILGIGVIFMLIPGLEGSPSAGIDAIAEEAAAEEAAEEEQKQLVKADEPQLAKIKQAASSGEVSNASSLVVDLKSGEAKAKAKAYIQGANYKVKLAAVEALLKAGDNKTVKFELEKLNWEEMDFSLELGAVGDYWAKHRAEEVEEQLEKAFLKHKQAISNQLPSDLRVAATKEDKEKMGEEAAAPAIKAPASDKGGSGNMVTANVTLDAKKSNGKAWDAFGGMPDVGLCYTAGGRKVCTPGGGSSIEGGTPAHCQDSLTCSFQIDAAATSIEVVDIDMSSNDAVGSGPCPPGNTCRLGSCTVTVSGGR
jgi:hypothetical protein